MSAVRNLRITFPITKSEEMPDGRLLVSGIATSDVIDKQNERLLFDGSVKALSEWLETGPAVREQHDPLKAVGSGLEMEPLAESGSIRVNVFVSKGAPETQEKVRDGTLRAFSIGGKPTAWDMVKRGNTQVREISAWQMEELSLVDRPANPDCRIDFVKNARLVSGAEEENDMTTKAEEPDKKPPADEPTGKPGEPPAEGGKKPPSGGEGGEGEAPPKDAPPAAPEGEGEPGTDPEGEADETTLKLSDDDLGKIVAKVTDAVLAAMKDQTAETTKAIRAVLRKDATTAAWDLRLALDCLDMLDALRSYERSEGMNGEPEPPDQMPKLEAACTALREFIASEAQELLEAETTIAASSRKITLTKGAKGNSDITDLVSNVATLTKAIGDLKAANSEVEAMREGLKAMDEVRKGIKQILSMPVPGRAPMRFLSEQNSFSGDSEPTQREAILEGMIAKADVVTRPLLERELNFLRVGRVPK